MWIGYVKFKRFLPMVHLVFSCKWVRPLRGKNFNGLSEEQIWNSYSIFNIFISNVFYTYTYILETFKPIA